MTSAASSRSSRPLSSFWTQPALDRCIERLLTAYGVTTRIEAPPIDGIDGGVFAANNGTVYLVPNAKLSHLHLHLHHESVHVRTHHDFVRTPSPRSAASNLRFASRRPLRRLPDQY